MNRQARETRQFGTPELAFQLARPFLKVRRPMAPTIAQPNFRNIILAGLSANTVKSLSLTALDIAVNDPVYGANEPFSTVYFPESGLISIVSTLENGKSIEVGMFGREGISSSELLLGAKSSPFRCFAQVAGTGFRTSVQRFVDAVSADAHFREKILQFDNSSRVQSMQGLACNALHTIEQRCCRWLLMVHDRVALDDLRLSHEFLAMMLGVRRASVTEVLLPLQELALVRSTRGTISILNRKRLEERACECYWLIRNFGTLN
ncbi:Crp/Fnr family transcriptional regulator [Lacipirellula sp.]|uniref:Crp/Fnr family transcriptional regulator n=1 Tax=Lacipirellula sp. TaxID=2691419 RepID=UPI003D10FDB4